MLVKKKIMLPCIAAVAAATFVGTKALKSKVREHSSLLIENVEAISQNEQGTMTAHTCYKEEARIGTYTWKCSSAIYPDMDPCSVLATMKIDGPKESKGLCLMPKN